MNAALLGALVGLARCVDDAAPTAQTFSVFREGLLTPDGADEQAVQEITRRLNGEKWALHPDCRTCHNPCGRREDYFGGALETKRSPAIKAEIFRKAKALAGGPDAEAHAPLLYRAVFALGEDGDDRWLEEILAGLDGIFLREIRLKQRHPVFLTFLLHFIPILPLFFYISFLHKPFTNL